MGLIEVPLVVENFAEDYDGDWYGLWEEVESIGRTDEPTGVGVVATAKVHLVVKDEVVIGEDAFFGSKNLWKVTATGASEVGDDAFNNCKNLNEAILPSANSVGCSLFASCSKLTNVRLPKATSIGRYAFFGCYALRHITLHPNVNIDRLATFLHCLSLHVLTTCAGFALYSE